MTGNFARSFRQQLDTEICPDSNQGLNNDLYRTGDFSKWLVKL